MIGELFLATRIFSLFQASFIQFVFGLMARAFIILVGICGVLSMVLATAEKSETVAFPSATMLFTKCLAPLKSLFSVSGVIAPVCSAKEFSAYGGGELMAMDGKQIGSLLPSYFESLRSEQAAQLGASFINQLGKDQALAFSKTAEAALPANARKLLKKIKKRPGPVARVVIMSLSAITAFIIFKYS